MFDKTKTKLEKRKRNAYDKDIGRALKAIERNEAQEPSLVAQFRSEAKIVLVRASAEAIGDIALVSHLGLAAIKGSLLGVIGGSIGSSLAGAPLANTGLFALCGAILMAGSVRHEALEARRDMRDFILAEHLNQSKLLR